jgi:hypothetical protein
VLIITERFTVPRIRSLKPEHKTNKKIGKLSDRGYRLWAALVTEADDEGRGKWDSEEFRVLLYAYQPRIKVDTLTMTMQECMDAGLVILYTVGSRLFYEMHDWHDHQRIDHPTQSLIPGPNEAGCLILEHSRGLANLRPDLEGSGGKDLEGVDGGMDGNGSGRGKRRAPPAIPENLKTWLSETLHLGSLANDRHRAFWWTLERAYDEYTWLYFEEEIKKADAWIVANPQRAPTERGLPRFMRSWFDRSVEIGRRRYAQGPARKSGTSSIHAVG